MTRDDLFMLPELTDLPMGQISQVECRMLYGLAASVWTGRGDIVEIGSLYGKSTVCLARGMRTNAAVDKPGRLHAYDKWTADAENDYMLGQLPEGHKGSFRAIFDENTKSYSDLIVPHEGDVAQAKWSGRPIEILFIDCSVSREFHEMLFRKFYPFLMDGSILIHQDFFLYRSYYLPLMMAKLYPCFDEIGNMDTSMIYQMKAPIPEILFSGPLAADEKEVVDALKISADVYGGLATQWGGIFGTMLVYFYTMLGKKDRAEEIAQAIIEKQGFNADSKPCAVIYNLNHALEGG